MNKLSSLIDCLQELAYFRPCRTPVPAVQTGGHVARNIQNISAEIRPWCSFSDLLEKRLDIEKTLCRRAGDLRRSYEFGTADAIAGFVQQARLSPVVRKDKF
jgi:hypothetical protein